MGGGGILLSVGTDNCVTNGSVLKPGVRINKAYPLKGVGIIGRNSEDGRN